MITAQHLRVLHKILHRLEDSTISWAITGSLGMALQGVPVEVHDIDLQADRDGAYTLESRLAEYVIQPVRFSAAERICSYLGKLEIDGIQVEIMGALQKRLDDGSWEAPVDVTSYRRWAELDGLRLPVLSLEYEVEAYTKMGRLTKAEMLRSWLQKQKPEDENG